MTEPAIGQPQRLIFSIQSVPNRLAVFFSTCALSFFEITFKVTLRTTSPKMFIMSPVTECAVFFVLSKDGLFRRRHVRKFIIERSEPESSRNFTVLLKILTITYLRKFPSLLSPDYLILFLGFLKSLAYQQRVTSRSTLPQFLQVVFFAGQNLIQCRSPQI